MFGRILVPVDFTAKNAHALDVAEQIEEWVRAADPPSPVAAAVRRALDDATRRLADHRAEIGRRRTEASDAIDRLRAEHARLAEGNHLPPPPPYTRDDIGRAGRPGAPLWLLCDFEASVAEADRAGLEAREIRTGARLGDCRGDRGLTPGQRRARADLRCPPSPRAARRGGA